MKRSGSNGAVPVEGSQAAGLSRATGGRCVASNGVGDHLVIIELRGAKRSCGELTRELESAIADPEVRGIVFEVREQDGAPVRREVRR